MNKPADYHIVLSAESFRRLEAYKNDILAGNVTAGKRLRTQIAAQPASLSGLDTHAFLERLLATKQPRIFAESEIIGDGSDWNARELALLGDINVTMDADIFDNGVWDPKDPAFQTHQPPLKGQLLFTPGALLNTGRNFAGKSPDLQEVTDENGTLDRTKYDALIKRRMLPLFAHVNAAAKEDGRPALVTLPGIGCGAFAGVYRDFMGEYLKGALKNLLKENAAGLDHIGCIYYDPFKECGNEQEVIHGMDFRIRPADLNPGKPQLAAPKTYEEEGDDFSGYKLYKIVAWDHASLPGNDFFADARFTDDGVSAAATNSMQIVTGIQGEYKRGYYAHPPQYRTWEEAALRHNSALRATPDNIRIVTDRCEVLSLAEYKARTAPASPAQPASLAPLS